MLTFSALKQLGLFTELDAQVSFVVSAMKNSYDRKNVHIMILILIIISLKSQIKDFYFHCMILAVMGATD